MNRPRVAIVMINWNGLEDTRACLESLGHVDYDPLDVIVVDNGSRNDEAAAIRAAFSSVTVIETRRNTGFAGGSNIGIRHALTAGADYILCLNNDTVVDPDLISRLVEAVDSDPTIGIASPSIYYLEEPERIADLAIGADFSRPWPILHLRSMADIEPHDGIAEVPAVSGCALMMRGAVAKQIGGFDERYFAYFEDVDLCFRARKRGWRCVVVPEARVLHRVSASTGGESSPTAVYYSFRNCWRFVRTYASAAEFRVYRRASLGHCKATWRDTNRTLATLLGLMGCGGPRDRWRFLERPLRALLELLRRHYHPHHNRPDPIRTAGGPPQ